MHGGARREFGKLGRPESVSVAGGAILSSELMLGSNVHWARKKDRVYIVLGSVSQASVGDLCCAVVWFGGVR
jgi:hypothetical protein